MSTIEIDLHEARRYIAALTGSPDTRVTFQTFADKAKKGTPKEVNYGERDAAREKAGLTRILHRTLDELADQVVAFSQVEYTPQTRGPHADIPYGGISAGDNPAFLEGRYGSADVVDDESAEALA